MPYNQWKLATPPGPPYAPDDYPCLGDFCEWFAKQYKQRHFEGVLIQW